MVFEQSVSVCFCFIDLYSVCEYTQDLINVAVTVNEFTSMQLLNKIFL